MTRSREWLGFDCSRSATAPATCGHAIDVPDILVDPVFDPAEADLIEDPGAKMLLHRPKLLKPDRAFLLVDDATVIAVGTKAGEKLQASAFSLPAATTTMTPLLVASSMLRR